MTPFHQNFTLRPRKGPATIGKHSSYIVRSAAAARPGMVQIRARSSFVNGRRHPVSRIGLRREGLDQSPDRAAPAFGSPSGHPAATFARIARYSGNSFSLISLLAPHTSLCKFPTVPLYRETTRLHVRSNGRSSPKLSSAFAAFDDAITSKRWLFHPQKPVGK